MKTKRCTGCEEVKPVSEFYRNRSNGDGLAHYCKSCEAERKRKYYEANREKIAESGRRYREANKEKIKEKDRRYRENNKEKEAERHRRYYEANKEILSSRRRKYYEANKRQNMRQGRKRMAEANARSLELAHRQGLPWEDWEEEFVLTDNGLTDYQKAVKLGRSYESVRVRKTQIRKKARNELTHDTVRV